MDIVKITHALIEIMAVYGCQCFVDCSANDYQDIKISIFLDDPQNTTIVLYYTKSKMNKCGNERAFIHLVTRDFRIKYSNFTSRKEREVLDGYFN